MAHKARRRPSWKKNRCTYFDRKYFDIRYDKYSGFLGVMPKDLHKELIADFIYELNNEISGE